MKFLWSATASLSIVAPTWAQFVGKQSCCDDVGGRGKKIV